MKKDKVRIEIVELKPTYVIVNLLSVDLEVKMGRNFFQRHFNSGEFDVVNEKN